MIKYTKFPNGLDTDHLKITGALTSEDGKLGFYTTTPIVKPTATSADATDLASAITLVNNLKAKLIALGLIA